MNLRAWLREWRRREPMLQEADRIAALRAAMKKVCEGTPQPVVKFTGSFPMPTKDEMDTILADADLAAELRWKALEEAREREAQRSAQPAQRVVQFGRVRS